MLPALGASGRLARPERRHGEYVARARCSASFSVIVAARVRQQRTLSAGRRLFDGLISRYRGRDVALDHHRRPETAITTGPLALIGAQSVDEAPLSSRSSAAASDAVPRHVLAHRFAPLGRAGSWLGDGEAVIFFFNAAVRALGDGMSMALGADAGGSVAQGVALFMSLGYTQT